MTDFLRSRLFSPEGDGGGGAGDGGAGGEGGDKGGAGDGGKGGASDDAQLKDAIKRRDAALAAKREAEAKLAKLEAEKAERDAADAKAREEAEAKRVAETGEYKQHLEKLKAESAKMLAETTSRLMSELRKDRVANAIRAELAKVKNFVPDAVEDAVSLLSSRVTLDDSTLQAVVTGADGKPFVNVETGDVMTIAEFVAAETKRRKHWLLDTTSPGSGAGAGGATGANINGAPKTYKELLDDEKLFAEWRKKNPELVARLKDEHYAKRRTKQTA